MATINVVMLTFNVNKALTSLTTACWRIWRLICIQIRGAVAEWLGSGLQIRVHRFDSGPCLHFFCSGTICAMKKFLLDNPRQCGHKQPRI